MLKGVQEVIAVLVILEDRFYADGSRQGERISEGRSPVKSQDLP